MEYAQAVHRGRELAQVILRAERELAFLLDDEGLSGRRLPQYAKDIGMPLTGLRLMWDRHVRGTAGKHLPNAAEQAQDGDPSLAPGLVADPAEQEQD